MPERIGIELFVDDKGSVQVRGLEEALKRVSRSAATGPRSAAGSLHRASSAAQAFGRTASTAISQVQRRIFSLRSALLALGGAFVARKLVGDIIRAGAELQGFVTSIAVAFNTTAEEARKRVTEIRELTRTLPVETTDALRAFSLLTVTLGSSVKVTLDDIKAIAAASVSMRRSMEDIAIGIISLMPITLRRLGIDIDRTGKKAIIAIGDFREEVENTEPVLRRALLDLMGKKFGDALQLAARDFDTAMATFRSIIGDFAADVSEKGFLDFLTSQVTELNELILSGLKSGVWDAYAQAISDALRRAAEALVSGVQAVFQFVKANREAISEGVLEFWSAFKDTALALLRVLPAVATAVGALAKAMADLINAVPREVAVAGILVWLFGGTAAFLNPWVAGILGLSLAITGLVKGVDALVNAANEARTSGAVEVIERLSRAEVIENVRALGGAVPDIMRRGAVSEEVLRRAKELLEQIEQLRKQFVQLPDDVLVAERNLRSMVAAFEQASETAEQATRSVEKHAQAENRLSKEVATARKAFAEGLKQLRIRVQVLRQVAAGAVKAAQAEDLVTAALARAKGVTEAAIKEFLRLREEQRALQEQIREGADVVAEATTVTVDTAKEQFIDLQDVVGGVIDTMVDAWIRGTLDIKDAAEAMERAIKGAFARAFADALKEKLGFDAKLKRNFLSDIPSLIGDALGPIGRALGGIFGKDGLLGKVGEKAGEIFKGIFGEEVAGPPEPGKGAPVRISGGKVLLAVAAAFSGIKALVDTITGDASPAGFLAASLLAAVLNPGLGLGLAGIGIAQFVRAKIGGISGRVAGGLTGGLFGAAGGFLVGGPFGAIVGAIIGGIFGGLGGLSHTPTLGTQFRKAVIRTLKDADVVFSDVLRSDVFGFKSAKAFARATGRSVEIGLNEFIERDFPDVAKKSGDRLFGLGAIFTAGSLGLKSDRGQFGKIKPQRGLSSFANVIVDGLKGDQRKIEAVIADTVDKLKIDLGSAALALEELFPLFTAEGFEKTKVTNPDEQKSFLDTLQKAVRGVVELVGQVPNKIVNAATAQTLWNRFLDKGAVSAEEIARVITSAKQSFDVLSLGITAAFRTAVETGDKAGAFDAFSETVTNAVRDAVLNGLIEAFLKSAAIENILQPFFEQLQVVFQDLAEGNIDATEAAEKVRAAWKDASADLEKLKPVIDAVAEVGVELSETFDGVAKSAATATDEMARLANEVQRLSVGARIEQFIIGLGGAGAGVGGRVTTLQERLLGAGITKLERSTRGGEFDPAELLAGVQEMFSLLQQLTAAQMAAVQARFDQERQVVELERERAQALRDEAAGLQDLLSDLQEQLQMQEQMAAQFRSFAKGFRDFRLELLRSTQPAAGLSALLAEFRSLMPAALGGDQAALARVQELMPLVLQAAQAQFAPGTAQFGAIFQELLDATTALESVTGDAADDAEQQAEALRREVAGVQDRIDSLLSQAQSIEDSVDAKLEEISQREEAALAPIREAAITAAERLLALVQIANEKAGSEQNMQRLFEQTTSNAGAVERFKANVLGAVGHPESPFIDALNRLLGIAGILKQAGFQNAVDMLALVSGRVGRDIGGIPVDQFLADALAGFLIVFPNIRTLTDLENVVREVFLREFSSQPSGLLGFAEGGVVPGAPGQPQLAVVHGGETIIPAGGAVRVELVQSINIDGAGHLTPEGERELAERLERGQGELAPVIVDTIRDALRQSPTR